MRLLGSAKLLLSLQFEAIEGEGHSLAEISGIHQPAATGGILAQNQAAHRVSDYLIMVPVSVMVAGPE